MKRTLFLWNTPLKNGGEEIILHEITFYSDGKVSGFINHRWTFTPEVHKGPTPLDLKPCKDG